MRARGWQPGPPPPAPGVSQEAVEFSESVVGFARRELAGGLEARDRDAVFPRELWTRCAEIGLQGLPVPAEYGGSGAEATTIAAALEALGYGCADNGLIFSLGAQMWACELPLVRYGTEEQKRRYLPALCDGSLIAAHAMTEPSTGSDAFALSTTATAADGGWVLTGTKTFVTNAPESDLFVVFASTDRSLGFAGLCGFLVERDTPGLTVGPAISKMGLRSSHLAELFLEDCFVPAGQLLGREGGGMVVFNTAMRWERALILASAAGSMHRQLERCIAYARERTQFGEPIGHFQAVSHRLADMRLRVETARLMLYRMASRLDAGTATDLDAAMTKLHLSECFVHSSQDALEVHGGYGYMTEYGLEREVRDALASKLYSGTSDLQRNVIAHHLGLG
jgi:alkylation response protein AidB-like acyl-CoA dehydrogenase